MTISKARKEKLFSTLEGLLAKETPGSNTPLQKAVGDLVNAVHSGLVGRELEQEVHTKRRALAGVLEGLGMSAVDANDLTKLIAKKEQQGQGSGGPSVGR